METARNKTLIFIAAAAISILTACSAPGFRVYFYEQGPPGSQTGSVPPSDISDISKMPDDEPLEISVPDEYADHYAANPDMIGWLEIPGIISTPVVKTADNETYLTKNFDGTVSNYSTTIFADFRCAPESKSSKAMILYGHNLRSGQGFSRLVEYYPWKSGTSGSSEFIEDNPVISYHDFYRPDENRDYIIFAAACITADQADPYYIDPSGLIADNGAFGLIMPGILDRSVFYADNISISPDDDILVLSTCIDILGRDYETRFVLFARRLRAGEDAGMSAGISVNPDPLYFQAYYDITGTSWGGRKWNPALISEIISLS